MRLDIEVVLHLHTEFRIPIRSYEVADMANRQAMRLFRIPIRSYEIIGGLLFVLVNNVPNSYKEL